MKSCLLFTLLFGIISSGAFAQSFPADSATLARFADAARLVLLRGLSESVAAMTVPPTRVETVYVAYPGYPRSVDPPQRFFEGLSFDKVAFAPTSNRPTEAYVGYSATIGISWVFSPDSAELVMDWTHHSTQCARGSTPVVEVTPSPSHRAVRARVARRDGAWMITDWIYRPLK